MYELYEPSTTGGDWDYGRSGWCTLHGRSRHVDAGEPGHISLGGQIGWTAMVHLLGVQLPLGALE